MYGEKGLNWLADFGYKGRACELTVAQQEGARVLLKFLDLMLSVHPPRPFILANPLVPEVEKGPGKLVNKDQYLFPDYEKYATTSNSTH